MQITYIAPLSQAWNRMIKSLFKPFDIKKWFVLGFTAFLAHLLDWNRGTGGSEKSDHFNLETILNIPNEVKDWIHNNPEWTTLIIIGIILLLGLAILLIWLSSRGKFMFLDNVIHDRSLVKMPWAEYAGVAKSLFLWRLGYGLICFIIFSSYLSYCYFTVHDMYYQYASDRDLILTAIRLGIVFVLLLIAAGYISLFLNDFVVPIMYKKNNNTWIAWSNFMVLFSQHILYFLIYGLLIFILYILVVVIVMIIGFLTCCIGFVFFVIPYISSVILLPVSVVFRAYSLEFLQQFGTQYKMFPDENNELTEPEDA